MFIGCYTLDNIRHNYIYYKNINGYKLWNSDTFSPSCENIEVLDFKIKGKTYKEKQSNLEDLAKDWQNNFQDYSWSWGEIAEISSWFYEKAKNYGLVKVFKENGII